MAREARLGRPVPPERRWQLGLLVAILAVVVIAFDVIVGPPVVVAVGLAIVAGLVAAFGSHWLSRGGEPRP
jgi:multisubunit Na+/H+ antiporter MnhG subunit